MRFNALLAFCLFVCRKSINKKGRGNKQIVPLVNPFTSVLRKYVLIWQCLHISILQMCENDNQKSIYWVACIETLKAALLLSPSSILSMLLISITNAFPDLKLDPSLSLLGDAGDGN